MRAPMYLAGKWTDHRLDTNVDRIASSMVLLLQYNSRRSSTLGYNTTSNVYLSSPSRAQGNFSEGFRKRRVMIPRVREAPPNKRRRNCCAHLKKRKNAAAEAVLVPRTATRLAGLSIFPATLQNSFFRAFFLPHLLFTLRTNVRT